MSSKKITYTSDYKLKILDYYFRHGGDDKFGLKKRTASHFNVDKKTISRMLNNPEMVKRARKLISVRKSAAAAKTSSVKPAVKKPAPTSSKGSSRAVSSNQSSTSGNNSNYGNKNSTSSTSNSKTVSNASAKPTSASAKTISSARQQAIANASKTSPSKIKQENIESPGVEVFDLPEDPDYSLLKRSIKAASDGVGGLARLLVTGTEEVRNALLRECDVILECKVCRGLFRSFVNFLAHKRIYCQDEFADVRSLFHKGDVQGLTSQSRTVLVEPEPPPDQDYFTSAKTTIPTTYMTAASQGRSKHSGIDSIALKLARKRKAYHASSSSSTNTGSSSYYKSLDEVGRCRDKQSRECSVILEDIAGVRNAVFQSFLPPGTGPSNTPMSNLVDEASHSKSGVTVAINQNGDIVKTLTGDVESMEVEEESESSDAKDLTCLLCNTRFATQKTLSVHQRSHHELERCIYSCPICQTNFLSMWAVVRHLQRTHKKTKSQIERLRKVVNKNVRKKVVEKDEKAKGGVESGKDLNDNEDEEEEDEEEEDDETDVSESTKEAVPAKKAGVTVPAQELPAKGVPHKGWRSKDGVRWMCNVCRKMFLSKAASMAHVATHIVCNFEPKAILVNAETLQPVPEASSPKRKFVDIEKPQTSSSEDEEDEEEEDDNYKSEESDDGEATEESDGESSGSFPSMKGSKKNEKIITNETVTRLRRKYLKIAVSSTKTNEQSEGGESRQKVSSVRATPTPALKNSRILLKEVTGKTAQETESSDQEKDDSDKASKRTIVVKKSLEKKDRNLPPVKMLSIQSDKSGVIREDIELTGGKELLKLPDGSVDKTIPKASMDNPESSVDETSPIKQEMIDSDDSMKDDGTRIVKQASTDSSENVKTECDLDIVKEEIEDTEKMQVTEDSKLKSKDISTDTLNERLENAGDNETETKGDKKETETRGDKKEGETKGDKKEAATRGDKKEGETKGDKKEGETRGDKKEGETKGDKKGETKGGKKGGETKGGKKEGETKGGKKEGETKGDKKEMETKGGKKEMETKGDKKEAETKGDKKETKTKGDKKEAETKRDDNVKGSFVSEEQITTTAKKVCKNVIGSDGNIPKGDTKPTVLDKNNKADVSLDLQAVHPSSKTLSPKLPLTEKVHSSLSESRPSQASSDPPPKMPHFRILPASSSRSDSKPRYKPENTVKSCGKSTHSTTSLPSASKDNLEQTKNTVPPFGKSLQSTTSLLSASKENLVTKNIVPPCKSVQPSTSLPSASKENLERSKNTVAPCGKSLQSTTSVPSAPKENLEQTKHTSCESKSAVLPKLPIGKSQLAIVSDKYLESSVKSESCQRSEETKPEGVTKGGVLQVQPGVYSSSKTMHEINLRLRNLNESLPVNYYKTSCAAGVLKASSNLAAGVPSASSNLAADVANASSNLTASVPKASSAFVAGVPKASSAFTAGVPKASSAFAAGVPKVSSTYAAQLKKYATNDPIPSKSPTTSQNSMVSQPYVKSESKSSIVFAVRKDGTVIGFPRKHFEDLPTSPPPSSSSSESVDHHRRTGTAVPTDHALKKSSLKVKISTKGELSTDSSSAEKKLSERDPMEKIDKSLGSKVKTVYFKGGQKFFLPLTDRDYYEIDQPSNDEKPPVDLDNIPNQKSQLCGASKMASASVSKLSPCKVSSAESVLSEVKGHMPQGIDPASSQVAVHGKESSGKIHDKPKVLQSSKKSSSSTTPLSSKEIDIPGPPSYTSKEKESVSPLIKSKDTVSEKVNLERKSLSEQGTKITSGASKSASESKVLVGNVFSIIPEKQGQKGNDKQQLSDKESTNISEGDLKITNRDQKYPEKGSKSTTKDFEGKPKFQEKESKPLLKIQVQRPFKEQDLNPPKKKLQIERLVDNQNYSEKESKSVPEKTSQRILKQDEKGEEKLKDATEVQKVQKNQEVTVSQKNQEVTVSQKNQEVTVSQNNQEVTVSKKEVEKPVEKIGLIPSTKMKLQRLYEAGSSTVSVKEKENQVKVHSNKKGDEGSLDSKDPNIKKQILEKEKRERPKDFSEEQVPQKKELKKISEKPVDVETTPSTKMKHQKSEGDSSSLKSCEHEDKVKVDRSCIKGDKGSLGSEEPRKVQDVDSEMKSRVIQTCKSKDEKVITAACIVENTGEKGTKLPSEPGENLSKATKLLSETGEYSSKGKKLLSETGETQSKGKKLLLETGETQSKGTKLPSEPVKQSSSPFKGIKSQKIRTEAQNTPPTSLQKKDVNLDDACSTKIDSSKIVDQKVRSLSPLPLNLTSQQTNKRKTIDREEQKEVTHAQRSCLPISPSIDSPHSVKLDAKVSSDSKTNPPCKSSTSKDSSYSMVFDTKSSSNITLDISYKASKSKDSSDSVALNAKSTDLASSSSCKSSTRNDSSDKVESGTKASPVFRIKSLCKSSPSKERSDSEKIDSAPSSDSSSRFLQVKGVHGSRREGDASEWQITSIKSHSQNIYKRRLIASDGGDDKRIKMGHKPASIKYLALKDKTVSSESSLQSKSVTQERKDSFSERSKPSTSRPSPSRPPPLSLHGGGTSKDTAKPEDPLSIAIDCQGTTIDEDSVIQSHATFGDLSYHDLN